MNTRKTSRKTSRKTLRKFPLGRMVLTRTALEMFEPLELINMLARHHSGDWGDCCKESAQNNDEALKKNNRIFSVYTFENYRTCWIITEWDRSMTTILLPEDF